MPPNVSPPRGMRDFLPEDKARREAVLASIRASYSAFGYREIETPVAEEIERLESGDSGDNAKLIFRILRRGLDPDTPVKPSEAADLGLRFDLTVPLARFWATHRAELPAVFRAIQVAPVWRAERPQRGRYRQFTQCDIDVIGEAGPLAEVELIVATVGALYALGLADLTVRINDRAVLGALLGWCAFPPEHHTEVLVALDKLDKIGVEGVAASLSAYGSAVDRLVEVLGERATGSPLGALDALPAGVAEAGDRLRAVVAGVAEADADVVVQVDPTLVRGQGYYTGPIFEVRHPASSGSIAGGGRYDGMIGRMAGIDVPACGFSIGFERVVDLVDPARFAGPARPQVALVHDPDAAPGAVVAAQRRLIAEGRAARLVPRPRNLGRLLGQLAGEGVSAWASLEPAGDLGELRPLSADRPS